MKKLRLLALALTLAASFTASSATETVKEYATDAEAYQDIVQSLASLQPITFPAPHEKYNVLVFVDNQCSYCSSLVKNIKQYNKAGITLSFLTTTPPSIRDSVIADMSRVWCAADKQKSLQNAMAGFLPDNDSTSTCTDLIIKQSALSDRLGIQATPAMVVVAQPLHLIYGNKDPEYVLEEMHTSVAQ